MITINKQTPKPANTLLAVFMLIAAFLSLAGEGSAATYDLTDSGGYINNSYLRFHYSGTHLLADTVSYYPNSSSTPTYNLTGNYFRTYYFPRFIINNTNDTGTMNQPSNWVQTIAFSWISNNTDENGNNYSVGTMQVWNSTYSIIENRTYKVWWQLPLYQIEAVFYTNNSANTLTVVQGNDIVFVQLPLTGTLNVTKIAQQYRYTTSVASSNGNTLKRIAMYDNQTIGSALSWQISNINATGYKREIPRNSWYVGTNVDIYAGFNATYTSTLTNYTIPFGNSIELVGKFYAFTGNVTYNETLFGEVLQKLNPIIKPTLDDVGSMYIQKDELTSDRIDLLSISGIKYIVIVDSTLGDISHGVTYNNSYQQADPTFNASLALLHNKGIKALLWFSPSGISCNETGRVDPLNTTNNAWKLTTTEGGTTPVYYWSGKYCQMNPWSGWYDFVVNKIKNDTAMYPIDGFAFDESTSNMLTYYNSTTQESAVNKYTQLANEVFAWLKSQNKTVFANDRFSEYGVNISNVDVLMSEGIGKFGDPSVAFSNENSYMATQSSREYYGNKQNGVKYFNSSNWNESVIESSYAYAVDGWKIGWGHISWYSYNYAQNYSYYTLRATNGNRTSIPPRPADNAWNDFINVTSNYQGELWCLGINRNSSGIWNGTISCDGTTEDSWDIENHKFIQRGTPNSINTTVPKYHVLTMRLFNTSSTTFTLPPSGLATLKDTSNNTIDDSVPAQITSSTATSIKFNSSQNYTGTNWQISVLGDLTGKTWKYKAHNDNTWLTVPSANISYNGTHTLFDLKNINVSEATASNELAASPIATIESPILNQIYNTVSIWFNATMDKAIDWAGFSLDGAANITMSNDTTLHYYYNNASMSQGNHSVYFYANDTAGNLNASSLINFFIDSIYPQFNFASPTPANNSYVTNNWTEINQTITEANLVNYTFNWNGTNYSVHDDSLVLHMNFNKNNNIGENDTRAVDNSKYGNNGTLTNMNVGIDNGSSGWTSSGKFGNGMQFDGVNDVVNVGRASNVLETNMTGFTVSFWEYRMNRTAANDYPIGKLTVGSKGWTILQTSNSTSTKFQWYNDSAQYHSSDASINVPLYGWHYVTYVVNTTHVGGYVDGVLSAVSSPSGAVSFSTNNLYIGHFTSGNAFNGTIDEVRIYNRSLSATEIAFMYQSEFQKYNSTDWRFYNNISALSDGSYSYNGWANDTAGNVNQSETMVLTVDTTPPAITIQSPLNQTYNTTSIWFNITLSETGSWSGYSLDNAANVSMTNSSGNWNAQNASMTQGSHTVKFFANDTVGNLNTTSRSFTIDTIAPSVTIFFPENTTYNSVNRTLNFTATDATSGVNTTWYQYNSTNTTITGNVTFTALADQQSTLILYANDTAGNINSTSVSFTVYVTVPNITGHFPTNGSHYNPVSKSGVTTQIVNITTDRTAECRYSTTGNVSFGNMTSSFTYTNSTIHNLTQTVADGTTYKYYIRCKDTVNNTNSLDYYIYFDIAAAGIGGGGSEGGGGGGSSLLETRLNVSTIPNITTQYEPVKIVCDYESGNAGNDILGALVNVSVNNISAQDVLIQPKYISGKWYEATFTPSVVRDYEFTCTASKEGYISQIKSGTFKVTKAETIPQKAWFSFQNIIDLISSKTKDYSIAITNDEGSPVTLKVTTQGLGNFYPENDTITVSPYSVYNLKFISKNEPYQNFNGVIILTDVLDGNQKRIPLTIAGEKGVANVSLDKILYNIIESEINAPAFGWVAPKKVFNYSVYVPNWAVALIVAFIVDFGLFRGKKYPDTEDGVIRAVLFVLVSSLALGFLVYVV